MSETEPDPRALDLCAIGLGQAGGNLAAEWHRRGYRTLLFNTARSDFRALSHHDGLELEERFRFHIGIGGTDGAGKDPQYGAECLRAHEDEIRAAVEAQLAGADALLLCSGLGGGTGSAADELVKILEPLEFPIISVASLPADAESGITKVNAVKSANALVQAPLHGRIFIDNERLVESFPDVDVLSYFPHVNARVLGPLDRINRLNADPGLWSVRSFDGEDLRKVLLSGGVLQTHITVLDQDRALNPAMITQVVQECVGGGHHLASGLTLSDCAYLAMVVVGPERVLAETSIKVFDEAIADLKEKTGGAAVYEGIYAGGDDTPLSIYVLSASLALPSRVQALLGEAKEEGGALMKKISAELPELEISPLEGLDLFRAPTRRRRTGGRPRAPTPRPLGQQLIGDPVFASVLQGRKKASADQASSVEATEHHERDGKGDLVPRVGTGRHDEAGPSLETTRQVAQGLGGIPALLSEPSGAPAPLSEEGSAPAEVDDLKGQRGAVARAEPSERPAAEKVSASGADEKRSKRKRTKKAKLSVAAGARLASAEGKPRVGSGRHAESGHDLPQEPTEAAASPDKPLRGVSTQADQSPASDQASGFMPPPSPGSSSSSVRAGTGRPEDDLDHEVTEAVALSDVEKSAAFAARENRAPGDADDVDVHAHVHGENGQDSEEDLPFEYDIAEDADAFDSSAALTRPVDEDAILAAVPEEFELDSEDALDATHSGGPNPLALPTSAQGQVTVVSHVDELFLSSIFGEQHRAQGTGLQNVYEDLIDRFRQAPDRRGRERVARRLIDDSRSSDVEVRALAVWAMVKLEERGFRRALSKAGADQNPEISKLALAGLDRIVEP